MISSNGLLRLGVEMLAASFISGPALSQSVDASDYLVGADISNAIPGVSLSLVTLSGAQNPTVGESLSSVSYSTTPLSVELGTMQNGNTYSVLGGYTGAGFNGSQTLVFLQFSQPILSFSVASLNDAGDTDDVYLFGPSGIDMANVDNLGSACAARFNNSQTGTCQYFSTGGSYTSPTPISSMMVGSFSAAGYVLSVDAVTAPEITQTSAISSFTLLIGSMFVLRGRKRRMA
jgi:hypothetical protein